jgi:hypothetical protein
VDPAYAVSMATNANVILAKRATWNARLRIREAEQRARAECEAAGPRVCDVAGFPCGTGPCPFTRDDALRELTVAPSPRSGGTATRPRPGPDGTHSVYAREAVTRSLAAALG